MRYYSASAKRASPRAKPRRGGPGGPQAPNGTGSTPGGGGSVMPGPRSARGEILDLARPRPGGVEVGRLGGSGGRVGT